MVEVEAEPGQAGLVAIVWNGKCLRIFAMHIFLYSRVVTRALRNFPNSSDAKETFGDSLSACSVLGAINGKGCFCRFSSSSRIGIE